LVKPITRTIGDVWPAATERSCGARAIRVAVSPPVPIDLEALDVMQDEDTPLASCSQLERRDTVAAVNPSIEENAMSRTLVRLLLGITVTVGLASSVTSFAQDHTTIKLYAPGAFALGFTHIVSTPTGILYYNADTGAGAVGRLDGAGNHSTIKIYQPGAFATGFTQIVSTPGGILYYNGDTGAGAIGKLDSAGNHTTVKLFPAGAFATGWSRIVSTPAGLLFYNGQTGAGAVGRIQ
jgi:hypothetical protein